MSEITLVLSSACAESAVEVSRTGGNCRPKGTEEGGSQYAKLSIRSTLLLDAQLDLDLDSFHHVLRTAALIIVDPSASSNTMPRLNSGHTPLAPERAIATVSSAILTSSIHAHGLMMITTIQNMFQDGAERLRSH